MPTRSRQWVFRMPNKPLCQRAEEDKRRADLSEDAWKGSGKVYGYRKLHPAHCSETNDCRAADQASQFTSIEWAPFSQQQNLEHSMSRRRNCHDNANVHCGRTNGGRAAREFLRPAETGAHPATGILEQR